MKPTFFYPPFGATYLPVENINTADARFKKTTQTILKQNNMKTPMLEMIQNIIDVESKTYNQEQLYMLSALRVSALILLEEEKKHICNAYTDGLKGQYIGAGEYYNKTFKTK